MGSEMCIRDRDGGDRRRILVERQPAGAAALHAATAAARRLEREVLGDAADSAELRSLLLRVVDALANDRWPSAPRDGHT